MLYINMFLCNVDIDLRFSLKAVWAVFHFFGVFLGLKKSIPYCEELKYFKSFGLCMNEKVTSELQKCVN